MTATAMDTLVTASWLIDELKAADDLVVLDCTVFLARTEAGFVSTSGRDAWAAAHIPGAGFADLDGDLADPASNYRYAVPEPDAFAAAMGTLGVGDNSRVVLYDNNQSMWAARVWWMLRWIGFDRAAILDGGLKAWEAAGQPVSGEPSAPPPATLTARPRPELIATKADVLAAVGDGTTCLIDALPGAMYRGEVTAYGRPGHIPGATNRSASGMLDADTGLFRTLDELRPTFPDDPTARVITYCGGGIAASADAFILTRLGFTDVAVYTASLQEWAQDPAAPLVTE